MGFIEGRTRFGEGTRPTIYFAILAAVLTLPAVLLLAFPARALGLAVLGGATVVGTGVRRRDR
jgi:hypothetical protein